jgi:hypothetical protein
LLDTGYDGYERKEIDVEGITMVMLTKDGNGRTKIISQYPIPLRHDHKLPGLRDFSWRRHY